MNWSDLIDLITVVDGVDGSGFPTKKDKTREGIFANKRSVHSSEYYAAKQSGIKLTLMFEVRSEEYDGEEKLKHEGVQYRIERTYDRGEIIELTCKRESDDHV